METFELDCEKEKEHPSYIEVGKGAFKFYIRVGNWHWLCYDVGHVMLDEDELKAVRDALTDLLEGSGRKSA